MAERRRLLQRPPIVEVACGLFFEGIPRLDPLLVGQFWSNVRADYPQRDIKPPVSDIAGLTIGPGVAPVRCWLVSENSEFLMQIQPDRFYFNWRRRGDSYPRFGDHDGKRGVLSRALEAFDLFAGFCQAELGTRPIPDRVELTKIDDVAFEGLEGLSMDIPIVAAIKPWTKSVTPEINVRLVEQVGPTTVLVNLSNAFVTADLKSAVRIETRAFRQLAGHTRHAFGELNELVNDIFFGLFSAQAVARFQGAT